MKKKILAIASFLAAMLLFAGCSGMSATAITANWHKDNSVEYDPAFYEQLTYNIEYSDDDATSTIYQLKDFKGTYQVSIKEAPDVTVPNMQSPGFPGYKLESIATLSGTYAEKNGSLEYSFENDTIRSVVYFHRLGEGHTLEPVYSKTEYFVHAPYTASLNKMDIAISKYDVEIQYNEKCSKATLTKTDRSDEITETIPEELSKNVHIEKAVNTEKTVSKLQKSYSYFDNAQLFFIARGIAFKENSSATVTSILGNTGGKASVKFTCSEVSSHRYAFDMDGQNINTEISTAKVSMGLNAGNSSGGSSTLYFATQTNSANYRNLLLQLEEPYSFGMGTLVYKLASVSTQNSDN